MRRIVCIATLLTLLSLTGLTASAQGIRIVHSESVIATTDSSGVDITIEQGGTSIRSTGNGSTSMVIVSESDGTTLVCTLNAESDAGDVEIDASGRISVTWSTAGGEETVEFELPSIGLAGIVSEFDCEEEE